MCVWSSLWSVCPLCSLCLVKSVCPLCSLCLVRSVCPQCFLCLVRSVCPLCPLVWWDPCVHCVLVFGEILVSNVFVVFGEIRVSNVFLVFGEMLLRVSTVFLVHSGHTNLTKNKKYSVFADLTKHKEHSGHMDFNKYKECSGQIDHKELHTHMISQGTKGILLIITQRTLLNTLYRPLLLNWGYSSAMNQRLLQNLLESILREHVHLPYGMNLDLTNNWRSSCELSSSTCHSRCCFLFSLLQPTALKWPVLPQLWQTASLWRHLQPCVLFSFLHSQQQMPLPSSVRYTR